MILILFVNVSIIYAQKTDFKLSNYKTTNLKRTSLETDINLRGNYLNTQYDGSESLSDKDLNLDINLGYNLYKNSQNFETKTYSNINYRHNKTNEFDFYNINSTDDVEEFDNKFNLLLFNLNSKNIFYINRYTLETDIEFNYFKEEIERDKNNSERELEKYSVELPIKFGRGRVYDVSDAKHVLVILNKLHKTGKINYPNKETITNLANTIATIKNKRFFDSRIRKIKELETVYNLLKETNIIKNDDITLFANLNDMWDYGSLQERKNGARQHIYCTPFYYQYKNNGIDPFSGYSQLSEETKLKLQGVKLGIEFINEKSINIKWQRSINLNSYYSLLKNDRSSKNNNDYPTLNEHDIIVKLNHQWSYYPNTRTTINFGYKADYIKNLLNETYKFDYYGGNVEEKDTYYFLNLGLFVNAYYYFSPQLSINFNASVNHIMHDTENGHYHSDVHSIILNKGKRIDDADTKGITDFNYNLTLRYSIF